MGADHDADVGERSGPTTDASSIRQLTRVAAYTLVRREAAVLLARAAPGPDQPRSWWLPGGGLDFGEAPEDGARRETFEETGLEVRVVGEPEVHSELGPARDGRQIHHVRLVYRAEVTGGELAAEIGGSTDAVAWIPLDKALSLPLPEWVRRVLLRADIYGT